MTFRKWANKHGSNEMQKLIAKIPNGRSINQAVKEARITDSDGTLLALLFIAGMSRR